MARTGAATTSTRKKTAAKAAVKKPPIREKPAVKKAATKKATGKKTGPRKITAKKTAAKKAAGSRKLAVLTGRCLCGEIRYRLTPLAAEVDYCHCAMCRLWSGAPVSAWAQVPASQFRVTHGTATPFASSKVGIRYFCPTCGASIFMTDETGVEVGVMLGTLDQPNALRPTAHGWWPAHLTWLKLVDKLPHWPKDPPISGF
jgi:hypothetical protein